MIKRYHHSIALSLRQFAFHAASLLMVSNFTYSQALDDEVYVLSPFVVDAESDTGYVSNSTLAGTRIRTEVRDLGSSITVLTEEFLEDTGATGLESLLVNTSNTEVGGMSGNYSAGSVTNGRFDSDAARRNPQSSQRIRGLVQAELTRDFFSTRIPMDSYNVSQVTINRGPNSVLFGVGSPGGVIDSSLKKPIRGEAFTEFQFRFDQRGGYRGNFDINQPILEDRLTVRIAAMYDKYEYQQRPATTEDQRLYFTFDSVILKNESSNFLGQTSVRGYVEFGDIFRIPPDPIPPSDAYSYWYRGYQDVDSLLSVPGVTIDDLSSNLLTAGDIPAGSNKSAEFIPMTTIDNRSMDGLDNTYTRIPYFITVPLVYESGNSTVPGWSDPAYGNLSGGMGRVRWPSKSGRPRQDMYFTGDPMSDLVGFSGYSLRDRDVFDYRNNLLQGTLNQIDSKFNAQQVVLEQVLLNGKAGVELSFNRQYFEQEARMPLSTELEKEIYIDISEYQSNDLPNPNFGRPAVRVANFFTDYSEYETEIMRATVFAEVDFTDRSMAWGKWLGRHTLTGLFERRNTDIISMERKLVWDSDAIDVASADIFNGTTDFGRRSVAMVVYLGPSVLGSNDPSDVRITDTVNVPYPTVGESHNVFYWDNGAREVLEGDMYIREVNNNGDLSRRILESKALALKSNWLDDHIVTIFAWRNDSEDAYRRYAETGEFDGTLPLRLPDGPINPAILHLQDDPSESVNDDTFTSSIVGFFPEDILFELPFGADLSVHYFKAGSFQPAGFSQNILGERLAPPKGETSEYGFTLELLDRRLSLRFNWFETTSLNARTSVQGALEDTTDTVGLWLDRWTEAEELGIPFESTGAQAAAGSYDELYDVIINLLPEPTRSLRNFGIDENRQPTSVEIDNLQSTFDFVSDGMEIEVVGSIRPNWSIALNLSRQETVRSNTAPALQEVAFQTEQNVISSGLADVPDSPSLGETMSFLGRYQSRVTFPLRGELAKDGTKSAEQREWRFNLVTNYDFIDGPLKGVGIGGALRWQDEAAIGYPLLQDDVGNQIPDIDKPYYGDPELNGDVWVSYHRELFGGKIDWQLQINLRNILRNDDDIAVLANPDGSIAALRVPPEQMFFISNKIRF